MGLLDAVTDVVDGATDTATLGGNGPFVAYVERLSDNKRWLVSAVLGAGSTFPSLDLSFVDLSGNGQADLSVQVGVSLAADLPTPSIDRARVRIRRQTSARTLPPFRLVIRADGSSVKPADGSSTNDIPFVYLEFDDPSGSVDVPDTLEITVKPEGLNTGDPSTWVQRECATSPWSRDSGEPDGQQFDVQVDVDDGGVPTSFEAGLVVDGRNYTPSSSSDLMIASPTETPYAPTPAGTGDATIAEAKGAASELRRFDISLKETGATGGTTDVTLDACLWRELVAGSSPGLLDTQVAVSLENSKRTDLDVDVTSRDSSGTSTVDVSLDDVPTELYARAMPSRRAPAPGSTGASGQDAWIGYHADGTLGEFELDADPAGGDPLWLYAKDLPNRVGFTQAGELDDTFVVDGGDPDDLSTPMLSGIDRVAVELGPDRNGPPGPDVEVRETVSGGDTTRRFAVPGLDEFRVQIDPPPDSDSTLLNRRIEAFYHLSGAPEPLDATIDMENITGSAAGFPHEVTAVLDPDNRSTTAAADEPWLDYRADRALDHLDLDVEGAFWLWLDALPTAVGFTQAGELADEAFAVELGDPDDLTTSLPSPIDRAAVEIGPARRGSPGGDIDVYQTVAGSDITWRLAVPGLEFASVDVGSPPSADAGLLDRELNAHASLGGADPPIGGSLHVDDVAGFAGDGTIEGFPPELQVSHVPDGGGGHELTVDFGEERFGALDATLRRDPASAPGDLPYHRVDARVRWLSSLRAEWAQNTDDGSLENARIGDVDDVSQPVDGGLGQVAAALDADPDADPTLAPEPKLRFEQVDLADDSRLLVGAADLGWARFENLADGVEVEVVRAPHPFRMMNMRAAAHEQQSDYSIAVARTTETDDTPARTLVHGGHLHRRLQATITTADDDLHISTEGVVDRLKALHMVEPVGDPAWNADGLRADVSLPRLPERMDVSVGDTTALQIPAATRATVGLQNPDGVGGAKEQHVNAQVALPEGETTLNTAGEGVSVDGGAEHGITGRVALSRALNDLAAVRATPQAFNHGDTQSDGSSERVATTARVYGLRSFTAQTTSFRRSQETPRSRDELGLNDAASNLDLDVSLAPSRPNTSFRIGTFGADAPGRDPRWQSRVRLADIAHELSVRTCEGKKAYQTRVEASSEVGPLADGGDVWAEPAQIPWDGPAAGELVGVGLVEAVLESLPVELVMVGLPFRNDPEYADPSISCQPADPSGRDGFLNAGSDFHAGGQLIEVTGSLRVRDMLRLGWSRSDDDEDKWSRSDIACLQVDADDGGQFWLRQLENRDSPLDDSESKLNVMVDSSVRVSMAVDNYEHTTTRGSEPSNWREFSGDWSPSAKLQLKNFAGWVKVDPDLAGITTGLSPTDDNVRSGDWWVRQVGGWAGSVDLPGDVSLGSTSGTTFDKNPLDDVCGGDD